MMIIRNVIILICFVCSIESAFSFMAPTSLSANGNIPKVMIQKATTARSKSSMVCMNGSSVNHDKQLIHQGEILGVPYYHCPAREGDEAVETFTSLVLLHFARFTKEDWKASGILQQFCKHNEEHGGQKLSITALDLPNGSNDRDLRDVLDAMTKSEKMTVQTPASIVTPSMSGGILVSWIRDRKGEQLSDYIRHWIPVASGGVQILDDTEMDTLKNSVPNILAIYGDKDSMGEVSNRLGSAADAKVVKLVGRHPCYLDSPDEFVHTVLDSLFK